MQEKQDQKVVFVSLSIHTNFKHEEHEERTQKNKKPKAHCLSHSHFLCLSFMPNFFSPVVAISLTHCTVYVVMSL